MLRPFKGKGVNTSILTGMRAAHTMLNVGISRRAFEVFHSKCQDITTDLPYGKLMRFIAVGIANWKILDPIMDLARRDKKLGQALFDSISGHRTFKTILRNMWDYRLFGRLAVAILRHQAHRTASLFRSKSLRSETPAASTSLPKSPSH